MLHWLKRKSEVNRTADDLYRQIVAQARQAALYRDGAVPDTMEGRFEMIVLHLALALERLRPEGEAGQRLGQRLIEHLIADMDDALRQIGVGDMGVPRRVRKAAAALAERAGDYRAARGTPAGPREGLEAALLTHVYQARDEAARAALAPCARRLAAYVDEAARHLVGVPSDELLAGRLSFSEAALERLQQPVAPGGAAP